MHSVQMPRFRKFSVTSFLNLVTILLHDMLGLMKLLFLQFSDHLLPRRHKALQNLETAPLQIDFEHILFSLQTIDVAIIRCNLTLARVCSQTFIQSCLSSYLFSFMYFLEGANESCYLLAIQSQTMKLELPLTYEI